MSAVAEDLVPGPAAAGQQHAPEARRGLVIVHTGDGKGKTTAAFGMVTRMLAHGGRCVVIQFIKGKRDAATRLLRHPRLHWHCAGGGFTWTAGGREYGRSDCDIGWQIAAASLSNPAFDLVLLDELNIALACDYLEVDDVLAALAARPGGQHVVITGRHASPELVAAADLVTEMREVKHPFAAGVPAQCGIEY